MSMTTPRCPTCNSSELAVIGFFVLSHEGIPYQDNLSIETLAPDAYSMTRHIVQCGNCGKRATLEEAQKAADIVVKATYWDSNDKGLKRPIVCPICGNSVSFTRHVICAVRSTEYVEIKDGEIEVTESSDAEPQDKVIIRYLCAMAECAGRIELRSEDYALVSQS